MIWTVYLEAAAEKIASGTRITDVVAKQVGQLEVLLGGQLLAADSKLAACLAYQPQR